MSPTVASVLGDNTDLLSDKVREAGILGRGHGKGA
jgi:hypothetical protein